MVVHRPRTQAPCDSIRGQIPFSELETKSATSSGLIKNRRHPYTDRRSSDGTGCFGLEGLRVVDASIMPNCIRANTNVTTMMIGERISDFIRQGQ